MIGSSKHDDAIAQVFAALRRFGLSLSDLGDEDLRASNPRRREKMRRVERAWALMARLGVAYADLEHAEPLLPAKLNRRRRGERAFPQALENTKEPRKPTAIEIIEEFPVSELCAPGIAGNADQHTDGAPARPKRPAKTE
jgi:hypothetical protein